MKHDLRTRRWLVSMTIGVWRAIEQWRARRLMKQAVAQLGRRANVYLLDDVGIEPAGVDCRRRGQNGERHRFWML
ncbi:hypothetical protein JNB71_18260 [Rhizobium herbae]|uniref:Transposase IS701-like DDE domain-containing protein n=1 Tax=Rhizobium herbae TaxID=508661 RepID=A0ABS7HER3_9HYPH|nr:hypothetical protein [Rhizobium herbae]MBW9065250.1 hypothetical protein [Rhizobium herbae]